MKEKFLLICFFIMFSCKETDQFFLSKFNLCENKFSEDETLKDSISKLKNNFELYLKALSGIENEEIQRCILMIKNLLNPFELKKQEMTILRENIFLLESIDNYFSIMKLGEKSNFFEAIKIYLSLKELKILNQSKELDSKYLDFFVEEILVEIIKLIQEIPRNKNLVKNSFEIKNDFSNYFDVLKEEAFVQLESKFKENNPSKKLNILIYRYINCIYFNDNDKEKKVLSSINKIAKKHLLDLIDNKSKFLSFFLKKNNKKKLEDPNFTLNFEEFKEIQTKLNKLYFFNKGNKSEVPLLNNLDNDKIIRSPRPSKSMPNFSETKDFDKIYKDLNFAKSKFSDSLKSEEEVGKIKTIFTGRKRTGSLVGSIFSRGN